MEQGPGTAKGGATAPGPAVAEATITVASAVLAAGGRGRSVHIDVRLATGLPGFAVAGFGSVAQRELRDRLRAALLTSRLTWPQCAMAVEVRPPVRRHQGRASLDLPVAMALLAADGQVPTAEVADRAFVGELGLDGSIRPVNDVGALVKAVESTEVVVAVASLSEARAAGREAGLASVQASDSLRTLVGALRAGGPSHAGRTDGSIAQQVGDRDEPYLRPAGNGPAPDGWIAEPLIGQWAGQDAEVVYDPRRHEVAVDWHTQPGEVLDALEATGWSQHAADGPRRLWIRDRHAAARGALARMDRTAAAERFGPVLPREPGLGL